MNEYAKLRQQYMNDLRSCYGKDMINKTQAAKAYGKKHPRSAKRYLDTLPSLVDGDSGRRLYYIGDIASDRAHRVLRGEKT